MTAVSRKTGIEITRLESTRAYMDAAFPDACVSGDANLIAALTLPDPNDRHVLAAAIRCGAAVIVTFNEADFPPGILEPYGLHTRHPDAFMRDIDDLDSGAVSEAARADRRHYASPALSVDEYIAGIRAAGLPVTAAHLEKLRVLLED